MVDRGFDLLEIVFGFESSVDIWTVNFIEELPVEIKVKYFQDPFLNVSRIWVPNIIYCWASTKSVGLITWNKEVCGSFGRNNKVCNAWELNESFLISIISDSCSWRLYVRNSKLILLFRKLSKEIDYYLVSLHLDLKIYYFHFSSHRNE